MKEIALPEYAEISAALNNTALKLHASQVHGLICGILSGNPNTAPGWEQLVTGDDDGEPATHELLQSIYSASAKQLDEFLFELQMVLPDDAEPLQARAEALTLWCQGFLTGLKAAQVPIVGRKPSEMTEAIDDIIEIAKMNYEQVVATEEDESAYVELVEYVRMAVILIYQDLREEDGPKNKSKHLH